MKFRVWDRLTSSMQYKGFRLTQDGGICIADTLPAFHLEPGSYEVMFSTGIRDKDGKEIWEGDIVRTSWGATEVIAPAMWKWCRDYHHNLKVLGNKWQNPELLEKSDG